ncbi:MAG: hypoxanthine phosphoribosyltransferase [candidate division Zixibacteria bacterium]|nr:hypoxanthine phosphoribosyltransferase [candidate division Zixibacteria bacterium]
MQVLFTAEQLKKRVLELGKQISQDYATTNPVLVCLLKGSVVFLADLMRAIPVPHTVEFLRVSSYGSKTVSSGRVEITDFDADLTGRHVLVIEDIVDTGSTLGYIREYLLGQKPASLRVCALLDKPTARVSGVAIDYFGFTAPDVFVVGYGMDWDERFRHLPYVGIPESQDSA